jgi:membrane-bound lytic murein transglycosylase B
MRYNPAFRYALSVGLLADALAPEPPAGRVSAGADSAN